MATREEMLAFARRPWRALGEGRAAHWADFRRRRGVPGVLALAEELRLQVLARRPDWPSAAERAEDLRCHLRVSEALRRVARRRP
jgi:hypothetical protein